MGNGITAAKRIIKTLGTQSLYDLYFLSAI